MLTDKNSLEDIEIALAKMQGAVTIAADVEQQIKDHDQDHIDMRASMNNESFQLISAEDTDILDSGAMEHSSDSDYEPPGPRILKPVVVTKQNGICELYYLSCV